MPPPALRRPNGGYREKRAASRASSASSTVGTMMPSAPRSVAFWMLDSNASGMRTIGAAPTRGHASDHAPDFVPRHRAVLHLEPDEVEMLADLAVQLGVEARNRVARDLLVVEQRFFRAVVERPRRGGIHHGLHLPAPAALVGLLRRQRAADRRAAASGHRAVARHLPSRRRLAEDLARPTGARRP